jgi:hypothetical protein
MTKTQKTENYISDFYVLAHNPLSTANSVLDALKQHNFPAEKIYQNAIGDIIPEHYIIKVKKMLVASIYKPIACHSYNSINIDGKKVFIATIETMLSFYLAFLYINNPYEISEKMLCLSKTLLDLQEKHKLDQKGIFKRYTITCYGHQTSQREMREEKANMYEKLKKASPDKFLDIKKQWIDTVSDFMMPLCEIKWMMEMNLQNTWYCFEFDRKILEE